MIARGEIETIKILHQAAATMSEQDVTSELTYLQSIEALSRDEGDIIVMPIPSEILPKALKILDLEPRPHGVNNPIV